MFPYWKTTQIRISKVFIVCKCFVTSNIVLFILILILARATYLVLQVLCYSFWNRLTWIYLNPEPLSTLLTAQIYKTWHQTQKIQRKHIRFSSVLFIPHLQNKKWGSLTSTSFQPLTTFATIWNMNNMIHTILLNTLLQYGGHLIQNVVAIVTRILPHGQHTTIIAEELKFRWTVNTS